MNKVPQKTQKFKVGDTVKIVKRNLDENNRTKGCSWAENMDKYNGKIFKIKSGMINSKGDRLKYSIWTFMFEWLDLIKPFKNVKELNNEYLEYDIKKNKQKT